MKRPELIEELKEIIEKFSEIIRSDEWNDQHRESILAQKIIFDNFLNNILLMEDWE